MSKMRNYGFLQDLIDTGGNVCPDFCFGFEFGEDLAMGCRWPRWGPFCRCGIYDHLGDIAEITIRQVAPLGPVLWALDLYVILSISSETLQKNVWHPFRVR